MSQQLDVAVLDPRKLKEELGWTTMPGNSGEICFIGKRPVTRMESQAKGHEQQTQCVVYAKLEDLLGRKPDMVVLQIDGEVSFQFSAYRKIVIEVDGMLIFMDEDDLKQNWRDTGEAAS